MGDDSASAPIGCLVLSFSSSRAIRRCHTRFIQTGFPTIGSLDRSIDVSSQAVKAAAIIRDFHSPAGWSEYCFSKGVDRWKTRLLAMALCCKVVLLATVLRTCEDSKRV